MMYRTGESDDKTWFRSERFFRVADGYYFSTREGTDVGPYKSKDTAEKGLDLYIQCMRNQDVNGVYASKIALQGLWASTLYQ